MRKMTFAALLAAVALVVPAQAANTGSKGKGPKSQSNSKKCQPKKVAWVVKGTLDSHTLTRNTDGTYDGTVTIDVTRTNRHAKGEAGKTNAQYTLDNVKAKFNVADQPPPNSPSNETDLVAGDRVKLIGKITRLNRKCDQTGFTPTTTIRKVVFHDPATP